MTPVARGLAGATLLCLLSQAAAAKDPPPTATDPAPAASSTSSPAGTEPADPPSTPGADSDAAADSVVDDEDERRERRRALRQWRRQGLSVLVGPSVSVSPVVRGGGPVNDTRTAGSEQVIGIRYEDHGGILGGLLLGFAAMFSAVAVAGMPTSVDYGPATTSRNYNADGSYTEITRQTVTATYDDLEGRQAALDAAPHLVGAAALIRHQTLQAEFYMRDAAGTNLGDGFGYRTRLLFPVVTGRHFWLETGVGFSSLLTLNEASGTGRKSVVRGTPIFVHVPFGWAYASVGFDINWASLFFNDSSRNYRVQRRIHGEDYVITQHRRTPMSLGITTNLWMFQVRAEVVTDDYNFSDLGYQLSAGMRF